MGTQQILMIVLSVIVVGAAVAVGITMFNTQSQNSQRQAIVGDLQNYAAHALSYYKTPASMGGGGYSYGANLAAAQAGVGVSLGMTTGALTNLNGTYTLTFTDADNIVITGVGKEIGRDGTNGVKAVININGKAGTATISVAAGDTN